MNKNVLKIIFNNLLFKGTAIVFFGSILANFGNYLFHLLMGRWLGPIDYGILESLVSTLNMLLIPVGFLNLVVVKFISEKGKENDAEKYMFLKYILKKSAVFGFFILFVFFIFGQFFQNFLKIQSFLFLFIIGITFYISIFSTIFSSTLQGKMEFLKFCLLNIFSAWSKLAFGIILIFLGLGVIGAISSFQLSALFTAIVGYILIKDILNRKNFFDELKTPINFVSKKVKQFSFASLISSLSFVSIFSMDVILARAYLSPFDAGQYAALSVLGKIVFFASSPVISVMLPVVSEKNAKGEKYRNLVIFSILLVVLISAGVSFLYFLFPKTVIGLLFGEKYLLSANFLGMFAIFISLYSLCSLLTTYYLSISKNYMVVFSFFSAVVQILLLSVFHSSIQQIVTVDIVILSVLLVILSLITFKNFFVSNLKKSFFGGNCLPDNLKK